MHAILLTLLVFAGADQPIAAPADQAPVNQAPVNQAGAAVAQGECVDGCDEGGDAGRVARRHPLSSWFWDVLGPMPQTCYGPHFGCYPGSSRTIHRYPAFHGYYYRQPYNYRHLFDYPWHATPHQPVGFFAYQQGMEDYPNAEMQGAATSPEAGKPTRVVPKPAGNGQARYHGPQAPRKLQR